MREHAEITQAPDLWLITPCGKDTSGPHSPTTLEKSSDLATNANSMQISLMPQQSRSLWGLDLVGKLPTAKGQFKYIIVAIDYNSKWIEAEPLTAITTAKVIHFLWKNIYCHYGVPHTIITDNGTQFNNKEIISFTANLGTKMSFASVAHPQTNGQVEAANKIIKKLLKKKHDDAKGLWAERLPEVLWAIRTTPTSANGETPFCMMFGTEAVLPIEVTQPTARVEGYCPKTNDEGINLDKDLLEEKRHKAHLNNLQNKQRQKHKARNSSGISTSKEHNKQKHFTYLGSGLPAQKVKSSYK
ncbi:uncharacterized protein LOC133728861 [Rosa rugosa]|uniref:uncharacterized protein LOC133728861 n=1 Tax=Rosa rugosa TaxID=74645 RepID=UPI002B410814|nr:uncharacterized protein LOC133728861 [Rosa rugosa]